MGDLAFSHLLSVFLYSIKAGKCGIFPSLFPSLQHFLYVVSSSFPKRNLPSLFPRAKLEDDCQVTRFMGRGMKTHLFNIFKLLPLLPLHLRG